MRRILALAILTPHRHSLQAQQQTPPLAGIAHVAVRVRSLDAARDFYNKLGFDEAFTLTDKHGNVNPVLHQAQRPPVPQLYPVTDNPSRPPVGFLHVCFEGTDLQAIHDYYVAEGLTPTPVRKAGAGNMLFTLGAPASPPESRRTSSTPSTCPARCTPRTSAST